MSYAPKILDGIILAPRYLGSVEYFAAIAASRKAVIDTSLSFDKIGRASCRERVVLGGVGGGG